MLSEGEKCRQLLPSSPMSSTFLMRSGIGLPTVESSSPQARIWLQKSQLLLLLLGAQHRVGGLAQPGFCLSVFPPNLCLLPVVFFQCWSNTPAEGLFFSFPGGKAAGLLYLFTSWCPSCHLRSEVLLWHLQGQVG